MEPRMMNRQIGVRGTFVWSFVLLVPLIGCGDKPNNADKSAEKTPADQTEEGNISANQTEKIQHKPKKTAQEILEGRWESRLLVDSEKARTFFASQGVPPDQIADNVAAFKADIESSRILTELHPNGSYTETVIHPNGDNVPRQEKWEIVSEKGPVVKVKLSSGTGERIIEIEIKNDDTLVLTKEPKFEGMPIEPTAFKRK
jgi:hypothetical protein